MLECDLHAHNVDRVVIECEAPANVSVQWPIYQRYFIVCENAIQLVEGKLAISRVRPDWPGREDARPSGGVRCLYQEIIRAISIYCKKIAGNVDWPARRSTSSMKAPERTAP